jgi:hypothetical protein
MMFEKSKTVRTGVDSFAVTNDGIYCVKKNTVSLFDVNSDREKAYVFDQALQEICSRNTIAYANKLDGGSVIISGHAKELPDIFIKTVLDASRLLGTKAGKTVLYDYRLDQVLSEAGGRTFTYFLAQDNLFRKQKTKIENISLGNGSLLWATDIAEIGRYIPFLEKEEQEGEIRRFVGIWRQQLIVLLSGGKFVGIDISNGAVLWERNKVERNPAKQERHYDFGNLYHPFLDEKEGIVHILQGEHSVEFDLQELKAVYHWDANAGANKQDYLFITQSRKCGNQICFTASKHDEAGHDTVVGIFDIARKEVVWTFSFDFGKDVHLPNSQETIQMTDTAIFALDSTGTLHQFERQ